MQKAKEAWDDLCADVASVEKDVEQELQRKTKQEERITFVTFDEPISVSRTTKKRKSIRDFL